MATFASRAIVKRTVFGYNETDQEEVDDIEDANPPDDLPRGFGDFSLRVLSFGGSQSSKFGSTKGK